jgi:hypothetical protein
MSERLLKQSRSMRGRLLKLSRSVRGKQLRSSRNRSTRWQNKEWSKNEGCMKPGRKLSGKWQRKQPCCNDSLAAPAQVLSRLFRSQHLYKHRHPGQLAQFTLVLTVKTTYQPCHPLIQIHQLCNCNRHNLISSTNLLSINLIYRFHPSCHHSFPHLILLGEVLSIRGSFEVYLTCIVILNENLFVMQTQSPRLHTVLSFVFGLEFTIWIHTMYAVLLMCLNKCQYISLMLWVFVDV